MTSPSPSLPRLRQVILITADLDAATARATELFGFRGTVRDEEGMAKLGFAHEVFTFADTFLEIVTPLDPASPHGRLVAEQGDGGFMVDVQVADLRETVARAAAAGFAPFMDEPYEGQRITQWSPRDLGTLAEIDQVDPPETWHFAPEIFAIGSTDVARDVVGATLAVGDVEAVSARWAAALGRDATTGRFELAGGHLTIADAAGGRKGLVSVDLTVTDPARTGERLELCGVEFVLVGPAAGGAA